MAILSFRDNRIASPSFWMAGVVLMGLATTMIPCMIVSLVYGESVSPFLIPFIEGCKNDILLAKRRAVAIGELLKEKLTGTKDKFKPYEVIKTPKLSAEERKDVNPLNVKAQRFAVVEIYLNQPEIKTASEANTQSEGGLSSDNGSLNITDNSGTKPDTSTTDTTTEKAKQVALKEIGAGVQNHRYETEAEYFQNLSKDSPFYYKNLVEKFKYFSPAYHSITPEGFNARLTFLHQCTRQGHTIEASDNNGYAMAAGNLAFGRMPVCVLRIGDFLNTRILINSMSINYGNDGIQWDLNPEGAGVQPMYAKVSLQITILGGQSLSGPVSRLQNAVSFNYYANTGVYDDRADIVELNQGDTGGNDLVDIVEKNKKWYARIDKSIYNSTKETYKNFWSPTPNIKEVSFDELNKKTN